MKIRPTPPQPDSRSFEVDHQIALALAALHDASIRVRGAGRFRRDTATILLARDADTGEALEALRKKGIEGFPEPETQVGRGDGDLRGQHREEGTWDRLLEKFLPRINLETRKKLFGQHSLHLSDEGTCQPQVKLDS